MEEQWSDPGRLARLYAPAVYRLAYARTGSRADAEDIMQEVFLRLLRARPNLTGPEHAKAWLLRVTANCACDFFRAPWRRREGPLEENTPAPEGEREDETVLQAVISLPAKYRIPIHLYYYEQLSVAEIAEIMGKSQGTVKSRLFRARAQLREQLEEQWEEDGYAQT